MLEQFRAKSINYPSQAINRGKSMKKNRRIKVSRHYKYAQKNPFFPSGISPKLVLKGDWLQQAGFRAGEAVQIEIFDKMLVVTIN